MSLVMVVLAVVHPGEALLLDWVLLVKVLMVVQEAASVATRELLAVVVRVK
jgi:hypothetical protein